MDVSSSFNSTDFINQKDYLTPGRPVVWQCTNTLEFFNIVLPMLLTTKTNSIKYFSFHNPPSSLINHERIITYYIDANDGFESFTYQVYRVITSSPPNTVFLFDFLSKLHTSWVSDMMMANFFRILCPILAATDSCGVFPILRDQHSYQALRSILKTASIFTDMQMRQDYVRLQELHNLKSKVTYFQIQQNPLSFTLSKKPDIEFKEEVINKVSPDIWERYFKALAILSEANILSDQEHQKVCQRLMTQEEKMKSLIVKHFSPRDYIAISKRLIGTGKIGGKACGFLLGRKLIETSSELSGYIKPHDTYFIGTDVFYSYMVENNCWSLRLKHRLEQEHFQEIDIYKTSLLHGKFHPLIRKQFCKMLLHFKNLPIIIRSSSFLEDGYGNAFSGKYESVFCANQGSLKQRLLELETAIRKVYASTLSPSALEYRKKRNLLGQDEQMALLVQSVSGEKYGEFFFPLAAGVSFSYNPYRWMEHINPDAGMARLVAGLGTRAVNRTPGDYPRLVGLDKPLAMLWSTTKERHKFSQRYIDVLNLSTGCVEEISCQNILIHLTLQQKKLIFSRDKEAESYLHQQGHYRHVYFTDCQGIVSNKKFIDLLKEILSLLGKEYGCPVDIEFALDLKENGTIGIDLLQCRPLQYNKSQAIVIDQHENTDILFEITQASIRNSKEENIDVIVMVDPKEYYYTPHNKKSQIASVIGTINRQIEGRNAILMVPGRIGTSSPELGVPVTYAEVSQFKAICEVFYRDAGYTPELSYGSHMFQDLVEADIFYAAINENRNTKCYQPERLQNYQNLYMQLCPSYAEFNSVVHIYDLSKNPGKLYLDAAQGHAICLL